MPFVYLNSRLIPVEAALVPVFDRGFAYGDGIFETLKIKEGLPVFFREHFKRLQHGLGAAGFEAGVDPEGLKNQSESLAAINEVRDGRLRIQLTRGTPPDPGGPDPAPGLAPTLLVTAEPFTGYPGEVYREGISCRTVPASRGRYASVKSSSLLTAILARQEARAAGAEEAILTTGHGRMLEGSVSNVFFQMERLMITAPESAGILPGIVREKIIDIAAELDIRVEYQALKPDDLDLSQAGAYLTSSVLGICPVKEIDGQRLKRDETTFEQLSKRLARLEAESIRTG